MSNIKFRPIELNRQKRLLELYNWGRVAITPGEMFQTIALHRLTNKAQEDYAVTYPTALSYSKQVLIRLRKDATSDL